VALTQNKKRGEKNNNHNSWLDVVVNFNASREKELCRVVSVSFVLLWASVGPSVDETSYRCRGGVPLTVGAAVVLDHQFVVEINSCVATLLRDAQDWQTANDEKDAVQKL
jgi:hypothetical protein